jgi:death-on-curing protein
MIETLSTDDVLSIHEVLAEDFAAADDPISPSGVRSMELLESAVSRQYAGFHDRLKYDNPVSNAATLAYGICLNHPFHNGNKRTSLVTLLCHLDKNDLTFEDATTQDELYDFMMKVASHAFGKRASSRNDVSDVEVAEMSKWIRRRTRRVEKGERTITFRQLKGILVAHGFSLENPKGNMIDLVKYEPRFNWFGLRPDTERVRIMRIGNPGDGQVVGKSLIKEIRERCGLTDRHGVDSHTFYAKSRQADYFIGRYRRTRCIGRAPRTPPRFAT